MKVTSVHKINISRTLPNVPQKMHVHASASEITNRWITQSRVYYSVFRVQGAIASSHPRLRHGRHWWRKLPQVDRRQLTRSQLCRLSQTHELNKFGGELSRFIIWLSELELLKRGNLGGALRAPEPENGPLASMKGFGFSLFGWFICALKVNRKRVFARISWNSMCRHYCFSNEMTKATFLKCSPE